MPRFLVEIDNNEFVTILARDLQGHADAYTDMPAERINELAFELWLEDHGFNSAQVWERK